MDPQPACLGGGELRGGPAAVRPAGGPGRVLRLPERRAAEILGLVVALSGAIPLVLVAAGRLAGLIGPRTGHRVHETIVAVGVALTVLPALRPVEAVPGVALVFAALVLGAGSRCSTHVSARSGCSSPCWRRG